MATTQLADAQIYVGTYAKYNDASLFGKWMELSDYSDIDEFYTACRELHKDEEDPELMFQDWEYIPDSLINESWLSPKVFEIIEAIGDLTEDKQEAFFIWCDNSSQNIEENDIDGLISSFEDDYQGKYDSEEDFAESIADECFNIPESIASYFDYEKFANDLFMGDYWYCDGHVFCNR